MTIVLGVESTAHTFGVGIVKNCRILANVKRAYTTEKGGIIPMESAKHHQENKHEIYSEALSEAKIKEEDIDAIAFSQGPGLAPCLLEGMRFAKELSEKFKKPIVPVNHCVAHLEIGKCRSAYTKARNSGATGPKDPVMLYVSGANTQVIAYADGRYRIFGETLDIGVGNFIDNFARLIGIGFPGGPKIQELAEKGNNYIELPYKVKGMDIVLSGILTNLRQKLGSFQSHSQLSDSEQTSSCSSFKKNIKRKILTKSNFKQNNKRGEAELKEYTIEDLAFSMQETVFAMLVEVAERALAHTGKTELLLGGGVACNSRLQEMCKIMCKERDAKFFCPEKSLLVDNGAMIAFLGEIMFESPRDTQGGHKNLQAGDSGEPKGIKEKLNAPLGVHQGGARTSSRPPSTECRGKIDIKPRQRTDDVEVTWK
ncbi:tRNA (adenosine(37)-N6)-threonylcarbamoyltransferase complex transferase subunit TsaD [Candidatus Pacearchaeota archaeon]|nr:tRNA (adenosine(37)-N6)-threonylcarbamoyltransferase complex transferase subunit TsaD [Candidatus Pacearchaeota archaeon]